jgi:hypothetical protein
VQKCVSLSMYVSLANPGLEDMLWGNAILLNRHQESDHNDKIFTTRQLLVYSV